MKTRILSAFLAGVMCLGCFVTPAYATESLETVGAAPVPDVSAEIHPESDSAEPREPVESSVPAETQEPAAAPAETQAAAEPAPAEGKTSEGSEEAEPFAENVQTIDNDTLVISVSQTVDRIIVKGTSNLEVASGCTLTVNQGIWMEGDASLNITNMGTINAVGMDGYPAIGGDETTTLTCVGGTYVVTGGYHSAGIGGGPESIGPNMYFTDANITAMGGEGAPGIGTGWAIKKSPLNPMRFTNCVVYASAQAVADEELNTTDKGAAAVGGGYQSPAGPINAENSSFYLKSSNTLIIPGMGSGYWAMTGNMFEGSNNYIESNFNPYADSWPNRTNNLYKWVGGPLTNGYQIEGNPVIKQGITVSTDYPLEIPAGTTLTVEGGIQNNGIIRVAEGGQLIADITGNPIAQPAVSYVDQDGRTQITEQYHTYTNQTSLTEGFWVVPEQASVKATSVADNVTLITGNGVHLDIQAPSGNITVLRNASWESAAVFVDQLNLAGSAAFDGVDPVFSSEAGRVSTLSFDQGRLVFEHGNDTPDVYIQANDLTISDSVELNPVLAPNAYFIRANTLTCSQVLKNYIYDVPFADVSRINGYLVTVSPKNITVQGDVKFSQIGANRETFEVMKNSSLSISEGDVSQIVNLILDGTANIAGADVGVLTGSGTLNITAGDCSISDLSGFTGAINSGGVISVPDSDALKMLDQVTAKEIHVLDDTNLTAENVTGTREFVYSRKDLWNEVAVSLSISDQELRYEHNGIPVVGKVHPEDWNIQPVEIKNVGAYEVQFVHGPSGVTVTVPISVVKAEIGPQVSAPSTVVLGKEFEITVNVDQLKQAASVASRLAAFFGETDDKIGVYLDGNLVSNEVALGDQTSVTLTVDSTQFVKEGEGSKQFTVRYSGSADFKPFELNSSPVNFRYAAPVEVTLTPEANEYGWHSSQPVVRAEGCQVSLDAEFWSDTLALTQVGKGQVVALYVKAADGSISKQTVTYSFTTDGPSFDVDAAPRDNGVTINIVKIESVAPVVSGEVVYTGPEGKTSVAIHADEIQDGQVSVDVAGLESSTSYTFDVVLRNAAGIAATQQITAATLVRSIRNASVSGIADKTYSGSEITLTGVTLTDGEMAYTLAEGVDYDVEYRNNVDAGTATIIFTGKGKYSGTLTAEFTINPLKVSVTGVAPITHQFNGSTDIDISNSNITWSSSLVKPGDFNAAFKNPEAFLTVGTHAVALEILMTNPNFEVENAGSVEVTVTPRPVTVKLEKLSADSHSITADVSVEGTLDMPAYKNAYTLEYSLDQSSWQESPIFNGLKASTEYTVYVRFTSDYYVFDRVISDTVTLSDKEVPGVEPDPVKNGWVVDENGEKYWYDNGVMATDKEVYDPSTDAWYWFDADGTMAYSKDVYMPASDKWVRYDENGHMIKGEHYQNGWYWFDLTTGAMSKGFVFVPDQNGGKWVYYNEIDGKMMYGEQYIQGNWYRFDSVTGAMYKGELFVEGAGWYYYDEITGVMSKGSVFHHNNWYWYDPIFGTMQKGEICRDGNWYYYDETTGVMHKGITFHHGKEYYYDPVTGIMCKGWVTREDGTTAYYNEVTGVKHS